MVIVRARRPCSACVGIVDQLLPPCIPHTPGASPEYRRATGSTPWCNNSGGRSVPITLFPVRDMTESIKITTSGDDAAAIDAIVLAFAADPAARWTWPDPHSYLEHFPRLVRTFGGQAFEHA